jgi:hypothetical protein
VSSSVICLRTKPNRNGNSKRAYIYLEGNRITGVTDAPMGGSHPAITIKVPPSEINDLIKQAKAARLYA